MVEPLTIINTVIAGIGALSWASPFIYNKFQKSRIEIKLISRNIDIGEFNGKKCLLHFYAFNCIALGKDYNIKEIDVSIKYLDSDIVFKGELFWARYNSWVDSAGNRIKLCILPEDTFPYIGTIPKSITKCVYLLFKTEKNIFADMKELTIVFTDFENRKTKIIINANEINPDQIVWDDRIWKNESGEENKTDNNNDYKDKHF